MGTEQPLCTPDRPWTQMASCQGLHSTPTLAPAWDQALHFSWELVLQG